MPEEKCANCGGTGWKIIEQDGVSAAERCGCVFAKRKERLEESAGIPPLYTNASFENFLASDNAALQTVMLAVRQYTRDFPVTEKPGLLFVGTPGVGKTHLAVAALRTLLSRGFEGVFYDYQNLLERIKASYDPLSGQTDREAYKTALDSEILLLDDLGAHRITDWVEDTVTSLITYRCNNRKPLIATTNLPDPDAGTGGTGRNISSAGRDYSRSLGDHIGMRARSRLFEMCRIIRMPAVEDYRIRKAKM